MNKSNNTVVDINKLIDEIKGKVDAAKTEAEKKSTETESANIAKAYKDDNFEKVKVKQADGTEKEEYPEALRNKVREHVKNTNDGLFTEYYLSPDGKTIMNKSNNTVVDIDHLIDCISEKVFAWNNGDYDS